MGLTSEIKKYMDNRLLCWHATSSAEIIPNILPKEIFTLTITNDGWKIINDAYTMNLKGCDELSK